MTDQLHRFVRVDDPVVVCYHCKNPIRGTAYADILGPAFAAYYDEACAIRLGMPAPPLRTGPGGTASSAGGGAASG